MKISEVARILNAEVMTGEDKLDSEVNSACGSDMMSDVLAYVKDQGVLMTGLINVQVIRTLLMMDMNCVVFIRGKVPPQGIIDFAEENGVAVDYTDRYRGLMSFHEHGIDPYAVWFARCREKGLRPWLSVRMN
ncbi:MAG: hypothetical protein J6P98_01265, partial [Clostridia bacterium]|nr:hypothetical protein [Clostridia bacterium]